MPRQPRPEPPYRITPPYYPIVYVRGYAMTSDEREEVFYDGYYGFAATSVEKRQAPGELDAAHRAQPRQVADVFEGQLIRFMKMGDYGYADSINQGLQYADDPSRSIWISRFYDEDFINGSLRSIEDHAEELRKLVQDEIPAKLKQAGVDLGEDDEDYKVILIAHSMGGLVSRCLIQKLLPNPKKLVHRLVTMGTPHRGIELGSIPDALEKFLVQRLNPFDSAIFQEPRMRQYLNLERKDPNDDYVHDVHSLGDSGFPIEHCLCVIGSDYHSYSGVRHVTGAYSDGLVRQDRAYIVTGPKPAQQGADYPDAQKAFTANVHRAHSGRRGIVNSYESFENIQRFLFGDVKVEIYLDNLQLNVPAPRDNEQKFYDVEFKLSVRGSNTYLHQRNQEPCENAMRFEHAQLSGAQMMRLHAGFLNSRLARPDDPSLHFLLALRVVEYRVVDRWLFDKNYPGRTIYSESVEVRVTDANDPVRPSVVEYRWLSDLHGWTQVAGDGIVGDNQESYHFPLREAGTLQGDMVLKASVWPG